MSNLPPIRLSQRFRIATVVAMTVCLPAVALAQAPVRTAPPPARQKPAAQAPAAQLPAARAPTTQGTAQGSAPARTSGGDDVVARVGDANISADDLRTYVTALGAREQAALAKDPALLSQAVRLLLANRLVLQEVVAKKWEQQPNVVTQLGRVRENALVELYLQSVSTPPADFPSDDEIQKVYDANRGSLVAPRQYQLSQIFVAIPRETDKIAEDKAKKKLDDIQKKLKAPGADFAAISSADSDSPGGGELGWLAEAQIIPEIRTQIAGLAKGAISEPVRLDDGWHILRLIDTKASYTRPLSEVRDQLVEQMRTERATMLRRAYLAELLKQHPPVLNELALSNLLDSPRK
jgi:parvulin-like peptidyl-prolyl isomerase